MGCEAATKVGDAEAVITMIRQWAGLTWSDFAGAAGVVCDVAAVNDDVAMLSCVEAAMGGVVAGVVYDEAAMGGGVTALSCDEASVCGVATLNGMCRDELR